MAYLVCLLLTGWGWGRLSAPLLRGSSLDGVSLRFFLGLLAIPLGLFCLHQFLFIPLQPAAWAIFGLSLVGTGLSVKELWPARSGLMDRLRHPFPFFCLLIFILWLMSGAPAYLVHRWDEYSHWMAMPRQIYYAGDWLGRQFVIQRHITYTPGYPLLIDYPVWVFGLEWSKQFFLFVPLLINAAVLGLCFDAADKISTPARWLLVVAVTGWPLTGTLFLDDVLIDPVLESLVAGIFLVALAEHRNVLAKTAVLGLILAAGYLLKKPFVGVLVPIFFWVAAGESDGGPRISWRDRLTNVAIVLIPFAAVAIAWVFATRDYKNLFETKPPPGEGYLAVFLSARSAEILVSILRGYVKVALEHKVFFLLAALVVWRFPKRPRWRFAGAWALYFVFYTFGLLWLYLLAFPADVKVDPNELPSLDRYSFYFFGPFLLICFVSLPLVMKRLVTMAERPAFARATRASFVLIFVYAAGATATRGLEWTRQVASFAAEDRYSPDLPRRFESVWVETEAEEIKRILAERGVVSPRILVIAQGHSGVEGWAATMFSFGAAGAPVYRTEMRHSFYEREDSTPYKNGTRMSAQEMRELLASNDGLWVMATDEWIREVLRDAGLNCDWSRHVFVLQKSCFAVSGRGG